MSDIIVLTEEDTKEFQERFYVYAYLDPRKLGKYSYEGLDMCFLAEPFYIGKGQNTRYNDHLKKSNLKKVTYKNSIINKLLSLGLYPIIIKIYDSITEEDSFKLEKLSIQNIGRYNYKEGPLANIKPGGGHCYTESERISRSNNIKGENNPNYGNKWTEEQKENLRKQRIGVCNYRHTEEWKTHISNKYKNDPARSLKVIQFDFEGMKISEYPSCAEAARSLNKSKTCIWSALKYKTSMYGYFWLSPDDEDIIDDVFINIRDYIKTGCKEVIQFDLDGNKIAEYPSCVDASNITNEKFSGICSSRRDKKPMYGYFWLSPDDEDIIDNVFITAKQYIKIKPIIVIQFDFEGNKIAEYYSWVEASRGIGRQSGSNIQNASKLKKAMYGFLWLSPNDEDIVNDVFVNVKDYIRTNSKTVKQVDEYGNTIKVWDSIREACSFYNVSSGGLTYSIKNKTIKFGYYWEK